MQEIWVQFLGVWIDAFDLWCWRRLLRVAWIARRSNQSILKEISQSWIFIGRTNVEAEAPILWSPVAKIWLIGKDPGAGKDWRQEKGMIEDEMVGWHHRLKDYEFEQAPEVGDGQESLACCSPRDLKEWLWHTKSWTWLSNWAKLQGDSVLVKLCDSGIS